MWQTAVKTYSSQGPTRGWAPQNPEAAILGMVMAILCRRSLPDKGTGTRKGMAYGGNRKRPGYIQVWFIPGGAGEVRGQAAKQGFFLGGKEASLERMDTERERVQAEARPEVPEAGEQWSQRLTTRMLAKAGKNGKA